MRAKATDFECSGGKTQLGVVVTRGAILEPPWEDLLTQPGSTGDLAPIGREGQTSRAKFNLEVSV
jgi:hypothetical protein